MRNKLSLFSIINGLLLLAMALSCVIPFINILAISLSSATAASKGLVNLWPVDFSLSSYNYVISNSQFWRSYLITMERLVLGVSINLFLIFITAYPLSKTTKSFPFRPFYVWFFFITMLFGGGLIPTYMVVKTTGLINSIFALVIPGAVPVFSIVVMLNFFRQHPVELEEAAIIDGASQWFILWKIWLPISLPAIATMGLFSIVGHWNSWFDGVVYMNDPRYYPMQTYLRTLIQGTKPKIDMSLLDITDIANISDRTFRAAQIFVAAFPILLFYPFLQKYFVKGLVIGSVKG